MLINHSVIYLIAKLLPGIVNFIGVMYYTRNISPENYGVYFIALSLIFFVDTIIAQWFRVSIVRFLPNESKSDRGSMVSTVFSLLILFSVFGALIVIGLFTIHLPITMFMRNIMVLCIFLFITLSWYELLLELIRSDLNPKLYSIYTSIRALITIIVSVLLISIGLDIYSLFWGNIISALLISMFSLRQFKGDFNKFTLNKKLIRKFFSYGLPISVATGLNFIVYDSDRIMLAWIHDTYVAGEYAVAYDLVKQVLTILIFPISLASIPIIFQTTEKQGLEATKTELSKTFKVLLMLSLPATIALIVLSKNISYVILGSQYREVAIEIIPVIAVGIFFAGLTNKYILLAFQITKKTIKQINIAVIITILNLLLNLILIPRFKGVGAAYATSISLIVGLIITYFLSKKYLKLPFPIMDIIKVCTAATTMGLILFLFSSQTGLLWLFLQIIIGLMVYVLCLIILYFPKVYNSFSLILNKWRG